MFTKQVAIIGSGPAGYTAAIYAARANLSPILISGSDEGGQLTTTTDVENYPGFANVIQGPWLMEQMKAQALHVGAQIVTDHIKSVDFSSRPFTLIGERATYVTQSVIIATGAQAEWLNIPSEQAFRGRGVSGCATCDGFFYRGMTVGVIGGGNTAVEEALYLTKHAAKVYLIHRGGTLRAEKILQDRLFDHPKIEVIWHHTLLEVFGTDVVEGARLHNVNTGDVQTIAMEGLFIAIGHKPATEAFVNSGIELDKDGYIVVQSGSTRTNILGVFAAGDVQDRHYRQAVTAAGTGCMAALDALAFLEEA